MCPASLLRQILLNIVEHPEDAKYRKLASDEVKLDGVTKAMEFLEAVGFQRSSTHLVLPGSVSVSFCPSRLLAVG